MDSRSLELAKGLVSPKYIQLASESLNSQQSAIRSILAQRCLPECPLPDVVIERLLCDLASMDTNNFVGHVGAGEREGRVVNELVRRRHFFMAHGVGRSGDISADQPKAPGSTLMYQLANILALDALRLAGAPATEAALVVPIATGMTLALVLRTIQSTMRDASANVVVWPRIDQRTCLKCIAAAGFVPEVVELRREVREGCSAFFLVVSAEDVEAAIQRIGPSRIVCVLSTTSCFSPRVPDDTLAIGRVCKKFDIPLVVNNAYGVQSEQLMKRINSSFEASHNGSRLDCFVQSTDKNFLVPVGGAVIAGPRAVVSSAAAMWAGRASNGPILDLFITLLGLGRSGFRSLLSTRAAITGRFHAGVAEFAATKGEQLIAHPKNDISFGITLRTLRDPLELGARLLYRGVSGPRVLAVTAPSKRICGICFHRYGTHTTEENVPLLIMASGIGMQQHEVDVFIEKLKTAWADLAT